MGLGFRGFGRLSILQVKFGLKGTFVPILLFRASGVFFGLALFWGLWLRISICFCLKG